MRHPRGGVWEARQDSRGGSCEAAGGAAAVGGPAQKSWWLPSSHLLLELVPLQHPLPSFLFLFVYLFLTISVSILSSSRIAGLL